MGTNYSIRFKTNSIGYSGGITISVLKSNSFKLDFEQHIADDSIIRKSSQVKTAILHGVNLFFHSHDFLKMNEYNIIIDSIEYNNIDSSLTIMTFVTYNALVDCFDLSENELLKVDKDKGEFIFTR